MPDIPNVRLINLVDQPAALQYNQQGYAQAPLDPAHGGVVDVTGFRQVSVRIGTTKATSCDMYMGKISGATLSERYSVPLDGKIHTFDVVGPQMNLWFHGGQPNAKENVQLWVYLRS